MDGMFQALARWNFFGRTLELCCHVIQKLWYVLLYPQQGSSYYSVRTEHFCVRNVLLEILEDVNLYDIPEIYF